MKLDLKELLAKITGQAELKTLLWTNPNTTTGFNEQTISLDLSGYDAVEIHCLSGTSGSESSSGICCVGKNIVLTYIGGGNAYGSGGVFLAERGFEVSQNGIYVRRGLGSFMTEANFPYSNNTRMIPWKIYGIRYVGGVLLNSILKAFSHLRIGGGVDESRSQGIAGETNCGEHPRKKVVNTCNCNYRSARKLLQFERCSTTNRSRSRGISASIDTGRWLDNRHSASYRDTGLCGLIQPLFDIVVGLFRNQRVLYLVTTLGRGWAV